MQPFCKSMGGIPCKRDIICNNITLISVNYKNSCFALLYIIKSCNRLNIKHLTQNINILGVY